MGAAWTHSKIHPDDARVVFATIDDAADVANESR